MDKHEAILVVGGGVIDQEMVPKWVQPRLEAAIEHYSGQYIVTLSAGTTHKPPPLDPAGFPLLESVVAARYLLQHGIPADHIRMEMASYDTIGNAYFSRVIHIDPLKLRSLLIITSEFHIQRTQAIFEWIYSLLPEGSPRSIRANQYKLDFLAVKNVGIDPELLRQRVEKEAQGLEKVMELRQKLPTWEAFHQWLFTEHQAYSASGQCEFPTTSSALAVGTY